MNLNIVQAEYGDCMILEYGASPSSSSNGNHYFLIDGGPTATYKHLREEVQKIKSKGGRLDLVIVSHIDNDHINGILNLMAEIQEQRINNRNETINVGSLWHNAFSQTIGNENDIEPRMKKIFNKTRSINSTISNVIETTTRGIREGHDLNKYTQYLRIPINPHFGNKIITVDNLPEQIRFGNLILHIVGPTKNNLEELKKKWLEWLDKYEDGILAGDHRLSAQADQSIPNLSSIMFLAEENGKKILFTGDGLGDHLVQGLRQANMLDLSGGIHVDVLKVPHHGSDRNVTKRFFEIITADKYVISANGKDDNPSLLTLVWIVEKAKEQQRSIEIIVTNETPNTRQLVKEYPPQTYGYKLTVMEKESRSLNLKVV